MLILHRKQALPFPILSLKYWRRPCFHDALNLFHVVFGFLNSFLKVMNATGDLNDIIPNACSPEEIELTEIADSGIAKGLAAVKDKDPILMGFKRLFCTGYVFASSLFLPSCIKEPTLTKTLIMEGKKQKLVHFAGARQCNLATLHRLMNLIF